MNCREEFEEWLSDEMGEDFPHGGFDTNQLGFYKHKFVHDAYVAWKASWNRLKELSK